MNQNNYSIADLENQPSADKIKFSLDPLARLRAEQAAFHAMPQIGESPIGRESETYEEAGIPRLRFRYRVVELGDLVRSHIDGQENPAFPPRMQPKDRSTQVDRFKKEMLAGQSDPRRFLVETHDVKSGIPVTAGAVVAGGNGRLEALDFLRRSMPQKFEQYRTALAESAAQFGIDPATVAAMSTPVLVKEILTPVDPGRLSDWTNAGGVMDVSERARKDSNALTPELLAVLDIKEGVSLFRTLRSPENEVFRKMFASSIPTEEMGEALTDDGRLSRQGLARLENAILHRVFAGEQGFQVGKLMLKEPSGSAVGRIFAAIKMSLPQLVQMEADIAIEEKSAELSLGEDLAVAIMKLKELDGRGIAVQDYFNQIDLFAETELTKSQLMLVEALAKLKTPKKIAAFLQRYADGVRRSPTLKGQVSFFEEMSTTKDELIRTAAMTALTGAEAKAEDATIRETAESAAPAPSQTVEQTVETDPEVVSTKSRPKTYLGWLFTKATEDAVTEANKLPPAEMPTSGRTDEERRTERKKIIADTSTMMRMFAPKPARTREFGATETENGDASKVEQAVGHFEEMPNPRMTWGQFFTAITTKVFNSDRPIELFVAKYEEMKGHRLRGLDNPAVMADMTRSDRVPMAFLVNGAVDTNLQRVGKSLQEILDPVRSKTQVVDRLLAAYRCRDYEAARKWMGFTLADANTYIAKNETPELRQVVQEIYKWQDQVLDYAVDKGLIDPESAQVWRDKNIFYAPIKRILVEDIAVLAKRSSSPQPDIKKKTGGGQRIHSPIESMIMNMSALTNKADQNEIFQKIHDLSAHMPQDDRVFTEQPKAAAVLFKLDEIKAALREAGIPESMMTEKFLEEKAIIYQPINRIEALSRGLVPIVRGGEMRYYSVKTQNADLVASFVSLGQQDPGALSKFLSISAQLLRTGVTLEPGFMFRNLIRDSITRFVDYGHVPIFQHALDLYAYAKDPEVKRRFRRDYGHKIGAMMLQNRESAQNALVKQTGVKPQVTKDGMVRFTTAQAQKACDLFLEPASRLTEFIETVNRFGIYRSEYERLRKEGLSDINAGTEAAYEARDFLNWSKSGTSVELRETVRTVAFLRSNLNGLHRRYRMFKRNPKGQVVRMALLAFTSLLMLEALRRDPEKWKEYIERPAYERHLFRYIPLNPSTFQIDPHGEWIRIPKGFEVDLISTIMELAYIKAYEPNFDMETEIWGAVAQTLTPNWTPSGLTPAFEISFNQSLFTGRAIEPEYLNRFEPRDRYTDRTSLTARGISEIAGSVTPSFLENAPVVGGIFRNLQRPMMVEYAVRNMAGGLSKLALYGADAILSTSSGQPMPTGQELTPVNTLAQFTGLVSRRPSATASTTALRLMEELDQLEQRSNSAELRNEVVPDNILGRKYDLNALQKTLQQYRQTINDLKDDPNISMTDKEQQMELERRNMLNEVISTELVLEYLKPQINRTEEEDILNQLRASGYTSDQIQELQEAKHPEDKK